MVMLQVDGGVLTLKFFLLNKQKKKAKHYGILKCVNVDVVNATIKLVKSSVLL